MKFNPLITLQIPDLNSLITDFHGILLNRNIKVENDYQIIGMFVQDWGSTALGFSGWGGQMITSAYTTVIHSVFTGHIAVYFDNKLAYIIDKINDNFREDLRNGNMESVNRITKYIEGEINNEK